MMKKYIKSIVLNMLWVTLFTLSSCDDYLTIIPTGQVIPKTTQEYRELLTSAYLSFPEDRGLASFRSDEFTMIYAKSEDKNTYYDIWNWNDLNPEETTASFNWRHYYNRIFIANHIILNAQSIVGSDQQEINQLVGEAYMLRAYAHFSMLNLYARPYNPNTAMTDRGIPLKLDNKMDDLLKCSSVEDSYKCVLQDIKSALTLLNVDKWDKYTYRFSVRSAHFLRSRVALYMSNWEDAITEAEIVLEDQPDLVDLVAKKDLPNHYQSIENVLSLEKVITAPYLNAIEIDPNFLKRYVTGDMRKSRYFKAQTTTRYILNRGNTDEYVCSMRTGELYLNIAEAAAQLGDTTLCKKYLYPLMEKRYNATAFNKRKSALYGLEGQELVNEILDERAIELVGEGHRWFDLRRTSQKEMRRSDDVILEQGDARYTLPFPLDAVTNNPGLNDGSDGLN